MAAAKISKPQKIWSAATIGLGFFGSVLALFAMRFLIGASQSAFVSIAPTVVVDTAEKKSEARALSYFYAALPLGTALGFIFGGLVSLYFGWRAALLYMGLVGIPLAAAMLWTKHRAHGKIAHHYSWFEELEALEHNPRYLWSVLGYAAQTFTLGGFVFWIPNFMQRIHGLSQTQGTIAFGALVVITGFVGTILGGRLADGIKSKDKLRDYLNLSALVTAIAIPFAFLLVLTTSPTLFYISMALVQIAIFATFPIINTLFLESTSEDVRGTAIGMANFSGRLLGDMLSIWLVGALSQATGNLRTAMLVLPAALIVNWAAWMMARNTRKA